MENDRVNADAWADRHRRARDVDQTKSWQITILTYETQVFSCLTEFAITSFRLHRLYVGKGGAAADSEMERKAKSRKREWKWKRVPFVFNASFVADRLVATGETTPRTSIPPLFHAFSLFRSVATLHREFENLGHYALGISTRSDKR